MFFVLVATYQTKTEPVFPAVSPSFLFYFRRLKECLIFPRAETETFVNILNSIKLHSLLRKHFTKSRKLDELNAEKSKRKLANKKGLMRLIYLKFIVKKENINYAYSILYFDRGDVYTLLPKEAVLTGKRSN